VVNLNGKGPCLYILLPILTGLPITGHHYIWPYCSCLRCFQKEGRNRNPTPNPVLLPKQYYLSKSAHWSSHSGFLHNDKVLLPNQSLFMLKGYFCNTSLEPAEHLLLHKSTSNWHKETEFIFEIIFRLQNIVNTKAGLIFDNCQIVRPSINQN